MAMHAARVPDEVVGVTRRAVVVRKVRAAWLIGGRRLAWLAQPTAFPRPVHDGASPSFPVLLHEQRVPLRRSDPGAHPVFEEGKRVNVALAVPALDALLLRPGEVFSFWRAVGRPTAGRGFRHGMELRGGCVVPALGGGLCLLSNALFRAGAELGWDIVERHGHTMEAIPSNDDPWGVDATIAWPYIDLRLSVPAGGDAARLRVRVEDESLVVQVWSAVPSTTPVELVSVDDRIEVIDGVRVRRNRVVRRTPTTTETIAVNAKRLLVTEDLGRSCLTCGLDGCAGRVTIR